MPTTIGRGVGRDPPPVPADNHDPSGCVRRDLRADRTHRQPANPPWPRTPPPASRPWRCAPTAPRRLARSEERLDLDWHHEIADKPHSLSQVRSPLWRARSNAVTSPGSAGYPVAHAEQTVSGDPRDVASAAAQASASWLPGDPSYPASIPSSSPAVAPPYRPPAYSRRSRTETHPLDGRHRVNDLLRQPGRSPGGRTGHDAAAYILPSSRSLLDEVLHPAQPMRDAAGTAERPGFAG